MCPCTVIHSVGHVSLRRSTTASDEGRSDDVVGDTDDDDDKSQCSTQEAVCVPFVLGYCLQRNICYVSRLAVHEAQKAGGEKDRLLVTMMTIAKSAINCRFTILIEGAGVSVALSRGGLD